VIRVDLLRQLLQGGLQASTPGPADDFWYGPVGTLTASGLRVDAEGAKKISAWFRGRDILATSLAMLPLHLYQRLPDDAGAEKATQHLLYDALHRKPHPAVAGDSFTWRRQAMYDLIDYGWAYDYIDVTSTYWGFRRIDPRTVRPELLKAGRFAGRLLFHVTDEYGAVRTHTQDEIFFRMAGEGKGILECARESLGLAATTETYAAKIFGSGAMAAGVIETPGPMTGDAMREMAQSFRTAAGDWHMPRVLPFGAKYTQDNGMTPEKAQMLLSRKFSVTDIARWLGIPPHMLMDLERATFSNIEHQGQEYVTYYLGPWLSLWEFAINDQLVLQPARFYAEFTREALVRGDLETRWNAHEKAVNAGIKTVDEVRGTENLNKRGGKADELREPQNIVGKPRAPEPNLSSNSRSRAQAIAQASAARVLRKEVKRVQALAVKYAADGDAFAAAVTAFYADHVLLVQAELLGSGAESYCAGQAAQVVANWVEAVRAWEMPEYAAGLASLALESEAA
jgi:HK97 family phage portal protein